MNNLPLMLMLMNQQQQLEQTCTCGHKPLTVAGAIVGILLAFTLVYIVISLLNTLFYIQETEKKEQTLKGICNNFLWPLNFIKHIIDVAKQSK